MVQLDSSLTCDVISRLSLMSLISEDKEVKVKEPYSDPSHLPVRYKAVLCKRFQHSKPLVRNTVKKDPIKLRLSFPIERSTERQLPPSYDVTKHVAKSRPLTPVLRVYCANRPISHKPVQLDFLKTLPVDITILLLKEYIPPADLLSIRGVCRHYNMLCDLRLIKKRWRGYLTKQMAALLNRSKENLVMPGVVSGRRMSLSKGAFSPIQQASTPPSIQTRATSPRTPDTHPSGVGRLLRRRPPPSPLALRPNKTTPGYVGSPSDQGPRNTPPPTVSYAAPRSRTPQHRGPPHHPSKAPPTPWDIKTDHILATPDKVTPSKRGVDGRKKRHDGRTPFSTNTLRTPTSTTSSKTSLSSTASLLTTPGTGSAQSAASFVTPELAHLTPTEFKIPSYSINTRSRQRLRRL